MTDIILQIAAYLFGAVVFVTFCWLVFMSWMLQKSDVDRSVNEEEEDGRVEQIKRASQPAPLDRPHVSAKNFWNAQ